MIELVDSILFRPDPTLTVDNVSCVIEKVEPDIRYKFGMMFLGSQ